MDRLYGAKGSGSAIIEAAFALVRLPVTVIEAPPWTPGPHLDALRAVNPLAQVPTLVTADGFILTESAAILQHIADLAPEAGLVPGSGRPARRPYLRWVAVINAALYPTFIYGDVPARWVGEAAGPSLRQSTDHARLNLWRQIEDAASPSGPYFLGGTFSAIDLYIAVMRHWRPGPDWFDQTCPRLSRVAAAVGSLPPVAEVLGRHF